MQKHNSIHHSHPVEPTNEEIALLAYSYFETEGRLDGHDLEHWLRAREQLSQSYTSRTKPQKEARPKGTPINSDAG